ncbi:transposase family protein [Streptomyces sp. NPDC059161]|uniref:transposase family protein n=1 Tax=Streptomyces sp. NPDC059161 TaxID=3346749 RepID=UPI0036978F5A
MPSSTIITTARHRDLAAVEPAGAPERLASLIEVLHRVPDLRRLQGRRYRLGTLLALYVLAVMAGARSLVAVCRFTAHLAPDLRTRLGLVGAVPALTTLSRLIARIDADALDDALGAWLLEQGRRDAEGESPGRAPRTAVAVAVDGKTLRGSRLLRY